MGRKPAKSKSRAKRPAARKPEKAEGSRVRALEKRLAEALKGKADALEQQTATNEVLKVISRSTFELEPVLKTLIENAARLCGAEWGVIYRVDGELLHVAAFYQASSEYREFWRQVELRPGRGSSAGRAALERRTVHIPDVLADPEYEQTEAQQQGGFRALLSVPMLRDGTLVGIFTMARNEPRPFTDKQVALLQTFADQAVIAIENVRLFNETKEALERQTATSEILNAISRSPTDVQPVLDTVVEHASRLCSARDAQIFRREGALLRLVAHHGSIPTGGLGEFTIPVIRGTVNGRAVMEQRPIVVADLRAELAEFPEGSAIANKLGHRSELSIPLMREGVAIGTLSVRRAEVLAFTNAQTVLLQTFADQAVIAIENVRLFKELHEKNRALTEALDQQTATSEILRVISSSATDTRPVFQTIVESAVRLSDALFGSVYRFDNGLIHMVAHHNYPAAAMEFTRRFFPAAPNRQSFTGRAIFERAIVHVPDVSQDQDRLQARDLAETVGFRSALSVPMLREGSPIGAITVWRPHVGPFSDKHIALLQTFADQAVIAIENEQLFNQLKERTAQLGRSVDELTALSQVSQALSSTLDIETVLTTIVSRAIDLSGADGGSVYEYDDAAEEFRLRATQNFEDELVEASRAMPLRRGEGALGMLTERRQPVQIADISDPAVYQSAVRDLLLRTGYRALLAVPFLREDRLIGALIVGRKATGEFAPGVVDVLTTFANQSALAIQNARLFREIADKSRQLEVASQHKSEFLANMSHELRTPLNAIIGFSEVLTERMFGELNDKQDEYLKDIYASGQHLLSLINDILDLSKIEAGRMELELGEFDLPTAIENALTLVRERASRHGIALHHEIDPRLGQVQGDERKVKQVLLNLLSNAIKFTPEGGRIDVRAALVDGMAEVAVADTGVGIAPEDQEAIFDEFRQVGTVAKKVEGTGLGLTLSRKFVELHGGRIGVQSQVGVGSTFTFTIPVRRGA